MTIGFRFLLLDRPWQPYLMIAWIVLIGHAAIGNVIDIDHWRHFYLLSRRRSGAVARSSIAIGAEPP